MKAKLLTVAMAVSMAAFFSQSAAGGKPQQPKHPHGRAVAHSSNNLPPEFGSASGSSGEGTTDNAPPPDEPADDGDTNQSSPPANGTQGESNPGSSATDSPNPQVVTPPTKQSGAVTTVPLPPPPYDACRNEAGIQPSTPLGEVRSDEGDCSLPRGEDNVGMCQDDQFILTPVSKVSDGLKAGQKLGPWVNGIGLVCWISDLVTYHANPAEYFFSGYYVGDGGAQDGLFACAVPYEGWLLYPYYSKKNQLSGQVFPSPGCA